MKKRWMIILPLLLLLLCTDQNVISVLPEPSPFQELSNENQSITLTLDQKEYSLPVKSIEMKIENEGCHSFSYGNFFSIEKELDGSWHMVMYSDNIFNEFPDFNDFGMILEERSGTESELRLDKLKLILEPGIYRVVKSFTSDDGEEILIAVPFKVIEEQG